MSEHHLYRPTIPPVPEGVPRPLWSVMIPTYNSGKYLRETLTSVLVQAPGTDVMQITVVDDHSTQDNPAAVVEELGQGRVEFYRQTENVGLSKNFQTCLELSRGKLIHQLHGDDCVRDGFYQKMQRAFSEQPEIGAAFCRNGIYIQDQFHAIETFQSYLPKTIPNKIYKQAKQNCAFFALQTAESLLAINDMPRAIAQVRAALKYSPSYKVIRSAGRIVLWDGTLWLLRMVLGARKHKSTEITSAVRLPES